MWLACRNFQLLLVKWCYITKYFFHGVSLPKKNLTILKTEKKTPVQVTQEKEIWFSDFGILC
jgi:hypothetical protein